MIFGNADSGINTPPKIISIRVNVKYIGEAFSIQNAINPKKVPNKVSITNARKKQITVAKHLITLNSIKIWNKRITGNVMLQNDSV